MFKNYLKIAWRNIWSNKIFTSINIISLSIGLSISFVIGALVYYDFSFDTFHKDKNRIYRVTSEFNSPDFHGYNRGVPTPLTKRVLEGMNGIEKASYFFNGYVATVNSFDSEAVYRNEDVIYTDKSYFDFFEYKWIAGSTTQILENPNEVVLTKSRAQKYFPNRTVNQIIGETLVYNDSILTTVTAIVDDLKKNTDLVIKEFISLKTAVKSTQRNQILSEEWIGTNSGVQLFVKLHSYADKKAIKGTLDALAVEHIDKALSDYNQIQRFNLQPLNDIHFNSDYGIFNNSGEAANKSSLFGLAGIGLFILILACINFINLNTARATKRAKEIGIFKTLGANKKQVIVQILGEMFLLTFIATLLSIVFANFLLKIFEDFTPQGVTSELFTDPKVILFMIALFILITFLSGFYPAFIIAKFKPTTILKTHTSTSTQSASLRKYLTVFQFAIAQVFILGTLLVGKQVHYIMNKDMGFKTEAVAYLGIPWNNQSKEHLNRLVKTLKDMPAIKEISLADAPPASNSVSSGNITYKDNEREVQREVEFLYGDLNYLKLYDIELLAGRERLNDSVKEYIINESYLKALGFEDPNKVLGKHLYDGDEKTQIVGVMKDFNQRSLKTSIQPLILTGDIYKSQYSLLNSVHFSIAIQNKNQWESALKKVENTYKDIYPNANYNLVFIDDIIAQFYEQEQKFATLLNWAMGLSILISCLGLFGLVIHTTQTRTKEISIRKVLGQKSIEITMMLSREFMKLIALAVFIGVPVAYLLFKNWLSEFSYKIPINPLYFLTAAGLTFLIASFTISSQTIIASRRNPAETLKED